MTSVWPLHYARNAAQAAGALALLTAIAFAPFLFGRATLLASSQDAATIYRTGATAEEAPARPARERDPGAPAWQNEPWLAIEHRLLQQHAGLWWDPYDAYGRPFAASQQTQPFFPLTLAVASDPSPRTYDWFIVARLLCGGIFAALFVLWWGGRFPAFAAGAALMFSGYYQLHLSMPHLSVDVMIPALLWCAEWLARRAGPASIATTGVVTALAALGGMPESLVVAIVTTALYFVVRTAFDGRFSLLRAAPLACGMAIGAAIAGVALVPLAELLRFAFDTHRTAGIPPGLDANGVRVWRSLMVQVAPLAFGPETEQLAFGTTPGIPPLYGFIGAASAFGGLTAAIAAWAHRKEAIAVDRATGAAIAALCTIVVLFFLKNQGTALVNALGALPVLRLVIWEKYDQAAMDTAAALLCGIGAAMVAHGTARARDAFAAACCIVAVLSAGYLWAAPHVPAGRFATFLDGSTLFALGTVAACAASVRALPPRVRVPALSALVCASTLLASFVPHVYGTSRVAPSTANAFAGAPYVRWLQARTASNRERVLGLGGMLVPNWPGAFGLDTPGDVDALYPGAYLRFVTAFLGVGPNGSGDRVDRFDGQVPSPLDTPAANRFLTLSSVRYVVVPPGVRVRAAGASVAYDGDARIYRIDGVLPRASIFHAAASAPNADAALRAMASGRVDVRRTLVLTGATPVAGRAPRAGEAASVDERDATHVDVDARLDAPGYVMLNDTFYPGWVASIDGTPAPIVNADYLFRAVAVPAGAHRIAFAYRSDAVARGVALSACGLVACLALYAYGLVRSPLRRARVQSAA